MKLNQTATSLYFYPEQSSQRRLAALACFATLITIWTIAGHLVLGFEQSYAQPVIAALTGVGITLLFEWLRAWAVDEPPRFATGWPNLLSTILPGVITGLAVGMLLYPGERLIPIVFAVVLSIASKVLVRVPVGKTSQHIFNPSNFGITVTLFLFPSVGLAPPYHFTENIIGWGNWLLPAGILASGIVIHSFFTGRLPLCLAWILAFVGQALIRSVIFNLSIVALLMPMTSAAFVLFTLYMIPDPATTPVNTRRQVAFGVAVAVTYGLILSLHIVFGLFLSLFCMSAVRGILLYRRR